MLNAKRQFVRPMLMPKLNVISTKALLELPGNLYQTCLSSIAYHEVDDNNLKHT